MYVKLLYLLVFVMFACSMAVGLLAPNNPGALHFAHLGCSIAAAVGGLIWLLSRLDHRTRR
jgi:hypothetical protein